MTASRAALARAEAVVDLGAISANVAALRGHAGVDVMAVVKADGYGHGITQAAQAARRGGAGWLGVATLEEALVLRRAGDRGPILSWLAVPGEAYGDAIRNDVQVSAATLGQLDEIAAASNATGTPARVQLKVDTGLGRGGAHIDDWPRLLQAARRHQDAGHLRIAGVWSHFACADEPDHPSVKAQLTAFDDAIAETRDAGLDPEHIHLANSAAALNIPASRYTMIRPGIAIYGISPLADGSSALDLHPSMTLRSAVALVKPAHPGQGVSYGHTYTVERETTLALIPLGYADGIPRHASGKAPVAINGKRYAIAGRVCMDQFVVDLGAEASDVSEGDPVVLFGPGADGVPTAHEWAAAASTIGYEIVTRIGPRVPRRYIGIGS